MPESFFNKVRPQPATSLKKRFWYRCFSVNFKKFLRKHFYAEHLWPTSSANPWDLMFQHICWMAKIIIYFSWLYVSTDYVLFAPFISDNLLILNSRGIKYKVGNFHFLWLKHLIKNLLHRYLMKRTPLRRSVWFYMICILIKRTSRWGTWNVYSAKHGISKRILRNTLDNLVAETVKEARFRSRHNKVY